MKNTQYFIDLKNSLLSKGKTKEEVYKDLNILLKKYNAKIAEEEFPYRERILKSERFSLFCVIQTLKQEINPADLKVRYNKNDQMKIAA